MRKSSPIRAAPSASVVSGTLKSTRTSTRFPLGSGRSSSRGTPARTPTDALVSMCDAPTEPGSASRADQLDQVDHPVGVAPLVVVPAQHLDERAGAGNR